MNIHEALTALMVGKRIRNERMAEGAFLLLVPGTTIEVAAGRPLANHFPVGTKVKYAPHIDLFTEPCHVCIWAGPTQSDLFTDTWEVVQ